MPLPNLFRNVPLFVIWHLIVLSLFRFGLPTLLGGPLECRREGEPHTPETIKVCLTSRDISVRNRHPGFAPH